MCAPYVWSWCAPRSRSQIPPVNFINTKIQITFLKIYDGCAFDPTMDLAPWCSTKVMSFHWYIIIGHENNVRRLLMVYNSMCHLMLYNSKLWGKKGEEGKQCAQVVDGVHQTGKGEWGYCDLTCPCKSLLKEIGKPDMNICCSHISTDK